MILKEIGGRKPNGTTKDEKRFENNEEEKVKRGEKVEERREGKRESQRIK